MPSIFPFPFVYGVYHDATIINGNLSEYLMRRTIFLLYLNLLNPGTFSISFSACIYDDLEANTISSDINALILDYLTVTGYPNAAARFCTEANLTPQQPNTDIAIRQRIQRSIHQGRIEAAIQFLNDLDPLVCLKFSPSLANIIQAL